MFILPSDTAQIVSAKDYLCATARGRTMTLRSLDFRLFFLRDCLSFGQEFQAVVPEPQDGKLSFIFMESCPYRAHEPHLVKIVRDNLHAPVREEFEAVPLYPRGGMNLWHWTVESLPKLLAVESIGYAGKYIIPADAYWDHSSMIMQSLALLGIDHERLLPSGPTYRIKNLILPQRLSGFNLADNMPLTEFLREQIMRKIDVLQGEKRLYVKRIGRRRVANEEDVLEVLNDFNFEVITPEELPLAEQFSCMSNVDCSVMAHGANSTLTLFQKHGSGAVEFFSNRYVSYNNLHCARLLKLRYYPLVQDLDPSCFPPGQVDIRDFFMEGTTSDIFVDTLHLRIVLEGLLSIIK